jgi:N-acetylmuramic acid 6-phosphate etherase
VDIVNDSLAALATATGAPGNGVTVVAGTGCVAVAVHNHRAVRVGGWGPLFGEAGSGFHLGRQALQLAAKAFDNQTHSQVLAMICEQVEVHSLLDVMQWVYSQHDGASARVASFAPVVLRAAAAGDTDAHAAVVGAAEALCELVSAVIARLGIEPEGAALPIVLAGGLFTDSFFEDMVQALLLSQWPGCAPIRCVRLV